MSTSTKRYFMCTPFDTAADGLYHLGTIIETPSSRTRVNTDKSRLPVSAGDLAPPTTLTGWTASAQDLKSGKFGFWTKVLYGLGIKPTAKYEQEFSANDLITCSEVTFTAFDPTYNYIKDSVTSSEVQEALKRLRYKSVYMITALMVGKDLKLEKSTAQSQSGGGSIEITGATDMIGGGGVEMSGKNTQATKMGYSATNVIVAYTLKKIKYTKKGDIQVRDWDKGHVGFAPRPEHLQKASDSSENDEDWELYWNELEPSDFEIGLETTGEVFQGETVEWVGPKLNSDLK